MTYLSAPTASGVAEHARSARERRALGRGAVALRRRPGQTPSTRRASTTTRSMTRDLRRRRAGRAAADRHGQRHGALPQRHRPGRRGRRRQTLTMLRAMPLGLRGVTNPVAGGGRRRPRAARRRASQRAADVADVRARRLAARLRELRARLPGHRQGARRRAVDSRRVAGRAPDRGRRDRRAARRRRARPTCAKSIAGASDPSQRFEVGRLRAALLQPRRADRDRPALPLRRRAGGATERCCSRRSASMRASSASR